MHVEYLENAVLFVNSTTRVVPDGRNVRTHSRAQTAQAVAPLRAQQGQFHVLDLGATYPALSGKQAPNKRRKLDRPRHGLLSEEKRLPQVITLHGHLSDWSSFPELGDVRLDPTDVLTVATFHIRRTAAMIVRSDPARLPDVLRCRQWACVSFALDRLGKSRCLDKALICVATKLRQLTGSTTSQQLVLATYSDALHQLQAALRNPWEHDQLDLLSTTQLLAIYEMLDSLEGSGWSKHVAGAASIIRPDFNHLLERPEEAFMIIAPLLSDMLLDDHLECMEDSSRRWMFQTFSNSCDFLSKHQRELMAILIQVVILKTDAKPVLTNPHIVSIDYIFGLLDRAHLFRSQLQKGLLEDDMASNCTFNTSGSCDILAMCLAGLVALDRLINALRPVEKRARESAQDKTSELCAQLLQLELGASDNAYAATDLMSAFALSSWQQQPGYAIILPPKG